MNFKTELGRLRLAGLAEGLSFILLLFVAMPLKYAAGMPQFVRVVGMIHGILFIAYLIALAQAHVIYGWAIGRSFLLFLSTLVPFGTFLADAKILQPAERESANPQ